MELHVVSIEKPEELNFILGHSHFIKTVEDIHEAMVAAVPGIRFGLAFCESSGPALVRTPAFAETMTFVMDFWNIPVYGQLLEVTQRELHSFIVEGTGTAQETMDKIADEQDKILRDNGFIKE